MDYDLEKTLGVEDRDQEEDGERDVDPALGIEVEQRRLGRTMRDLDQRVLGIGGHLPLLRPRARREPPRSRRDKRRCEQRRYRRYVR